MSTPEVRAARYALGILAFINLFNYLDRFVLSAVVESIKPDLGLTDTQIGFLASGFLIVYTMTSPLFGTLGDKRKRPPLIAIGVAIWSLATALGGFARGFWTLFLARSTVGVGEAAYGTIAPALLSDHFPYEKRGRVFSVFFAAIPIGAAAGYVLGGFADAHFGWRAAFFIAGVPGLLLSLLILGVKDPPRGQHDAPSVPRAHGNAYRDLLRNRVFVLAAVGYGAYTFALGGLAFWMPAFLERVRGMPRKEATVTFGLIALVTGFVGTFTGGWIGDYFLKRSKHAYLWVSAAATLLAAPATYVALTNPHKPIYLAATVIGELLIFASTGPINSAIVNAVPPSERATAMGLSVFIMHLLGDIPATPVIGAISDASSLAKGILVVPVAIVVASIVWCIAARTPEV